MQQPRMGKEATERISEEESKHPRRKLERTPSMQRRGTHIGTAYAGTVTELQTTQVQKKNEHQERTTLDLFFIRKIQTSHNKNSSRASISVNCIEKPKDFL